METTNDPEKNQSAKSRFYFVMAITLLFVLAITWSIDISFFYLTGGTIVFFFYLGLRNRKSRQSDQNFGEQYWHSNTDQSPSSANLLKSFFERKQTGFRSTNTQPSQQHSSKRFFVVGIVVVMFVLFFVPIVISLLSSGEDQKVYFFNAEQFYNTQAYDSAYVNYARAAKEDPANEEAFVGQGNSAFEMNRFDSALIAFDQVLTINPNNADVQYKKGLILYYQKKYDQSAQTLTALFEKHPAYFDALLKLGDVYYDQKRYNEALKYYDQAYANGVHGNWICYVSGYLYQEKGDTKKAIALYREALSYDSSVIDIYGRLGVLLPGTEGDFFRAKANEGSQE